MFKSDVPNTNEEFIMDLIPAVVLLALATVFFFGCSVWSFCEDIKKGKDDA